MEKHVDLKVVLKVLIVLMLSGIASILLTGSITYVSDPISELASRLMEMSLVALVIERAVEVYLLAFGKNGPDRHAPPPSGANSGKPATQIATLIGLFLGLLVSLLGVRVFDSFMTFTADISSIWAVTALWDGIDILISGGLLAGGAVFLHEIIETLVGSVRTINSKVSPAGSFFKGGPVANTSSGSSSTPIENTSMIIAKSDFSVNIKRTSEDSGKLKFSHGNVVVDVKCWWDPDRKITAGVYDGCSKTRMKTKTDSVTGEKRPAIYLPEAIAPDTGNKTIFIHEGTDPSWSDGCIVLNRDDMILIWNEIKPADAHNVKVTVENIT